jgi:hypothetical protein
MEAADIPAYDGWHAWTLPDGRTLSDLRTELIAAIEDEADSTDD